MGSLPFSDWISKSKRAPFIDNLEEWRLPCPRPPPFRTQEVRLPGRGRNRPEVCEDDLASRDSGDVGASVAETSPTF